MSPGSPGSPSGGGRSPGGGERKGQKDRGGPARSIGTLLPGALRALGVPSKAMSRRVSAAWAQLAEPSWRGYAAPVRIEGGALVVAVESAPLREELAQFHAERLLTALRSLLPDDPIVSIRFEAGRLSGVSPRGQQPHGPEGAR